MRRRLLVVLSCLAVVLTGIAVQQPSVAAAGPQPFGRTCESTLGVRWCPANGRMVKSFDGTPLDADVTLPPTGTGPWPTILLLHGLGGDKSQLEPNAPQQTGVAPRILPSRYHYNNLYYARRGYAVLSYSTRGFGDSCGGNGTPAAWLQTGACAKGFIRIADQRYEARDSQTLLGILADQGITRPTKIGVTGFSYGGGMAAQLAHLRNKVRLPDGRFVPWRSRGGKAMAIGAAYGQWLWTDLLASLTPNGRYLDFDDRTIYSSKAPDGVMVQSYLRALYGLAASEGYLAKPDGSEWDLTTAIAQVEQGEPYGAALRSTLAKLRRYHGSLDIPGQPAPMLLESGWNDDLFPPAESIRMYKRTRAAYPKAYVAMLLGDLGHGRDLNKQRVSEAFNDLASAFFDRHLRGMDTGPRNHSVTVFTTTCPASAPDAGPYRSASWNAAHPGRWRLGSTTARRIDSAGGNPTTGLNYDPIPQTNPLGTGEPCKSIAAETSRGTAVYQRKVTRSFTMMGLPTIRMHVDTTGPHGQVNGRLWDVAPDGTQRLVTRGVYRLLPDQRGWMTFQLHGNAYRFVAGHTVKLELAPSDAPYYRASNGRFEVVVTGTTIALPTRELNP